MAEDRAPGISQRIDDQKRAAQEAIAILNQDLRSFYWGSDRQHVYSNQVETMIGSLNNTIAHLERLRDTLQELRPS